MKMICNKILDCRQKSVIRCLHRDAHDELNTCCISGSCPEDGGVKNATCIQHTPVIERLLKYAKRSNTARKLWAVINE